MPSAEKVLLFGHTPLPSAPTFSVRELGVSDYALAVRSYALRPVGSMHSCTKPMPFCLCVLTCLKALGQCACDRVPMQTMEVVYSPTLNFIATLDASRVVRFWKLGGYKKHLGTEFPCWVIPVDPVNNVRLESGGTIAFSPSGRFLAVWGDNTVTLMHLAGVATSGTVTDIPTLKIQHSRAIVAFHPSRDLLVTCSSDVIHFWDVGSTLDGDNATWTGQQGAPPMQVPVHSIFRSDDSPDVFWPVLAISGSIIAVTYGDGLQFYGFTESSEEPGTLTSKLLASLPFQSRPLGLSFSADGSLLAVHTLNPTMSLLYRIDPIDPDNATMPPIEITQLYACNVMEGCGRLRQFVGLSPSGRRIVTGCGSTVTIYENSERGNSNVTEDLIDGRGCEGVMRVSKLKDLHGHSGNVYDGMFLGSDEQLATVSLDETIRIWHLGGGDAPADFESRVMAQYNSSSIRDLAVGTSASGRKLLASGSDDGHVRVWDSESSLDDGQVGKVHSAKVLSVSFSPASDLLASGSLDPNVILWKVNETSTRSLHSSEAGPIRLLEEWAVLEGHTAWVLSVAFSPTVSAANSYQLASASADNTVRLWEVSEAGEYTSQVLNGHEMWVKAVAWSADSSLLASGSGDTTIRIWYVGSGRQSPPELKTVLRGHTSEIESVAFDPNETRTLLASGAQDGTVCLWNLKGYEAAAGSSQGPVCQILRGHASAVSSLAFSTGGLLATGSMDSSIIVWNTSQSGADAFVLDTLTAHSLWVTSVEWLPGSSSSPVSIVSASADGQLRETPMLDLQAFSDRFGEWVTERTSGFALSQWHPGSDFLSANGVPRQFLSMMNVNSGDPLPCQ